MVRGVETRVRCCSEGGHACSGNPLPWNIQKGPFLAPKQAFKHQYEPCVLSPLGKFADGLLFLYEGFLAEMDVSGERTDIDFFIPLRTLKYRLLD